MSCFGFGSAIRRHHTLAQTKRRTVARIALTGLAGLIVFAVLPLPPSSDPGLRVYSLPETRQHLSTTSVDCEPRPCDMTFGGQLLLNWSVGSEGHRNVVDGFANAEVARLAMRTAPGAPQHFLPIMDLGNGQRVFYFSGINLRYGQFLAYDTHGLLLKNPGFRSS